MENKDYFNFCHYCLNPVATSPSVCAEGYEVANLVSSDSKMLKNGFMVYHTIRPPVDVFFNFMCKINISHIIIWPQVGNQKSSGFQIFTGTKHASSDSDNFFVNVGTAFLQEEPGILFHNMFQPFNENISEFLHRRLFSRNNSLVSVSSLQIRIMKTINSSVPALLKVEVWGFPSISCSKEVRLKVKTLWAQKDRRSVYLPNEEGQKEMDVLRSTAQALTVSDFEIPDDFLDSITCEIMVLPYTLPCGKVIDQTTLEKHEKHEANWGRRPSDPFTGKLFTNTSKPVFDVSLKARIDKFLLDHSDLDVVKNVPRTVGTKRIRKKCLIEVKPVLENSSKPSFLELDKSSCSANAEVASKLKSSGIEKPLLDIKCFENLKKKRKLLNEASSSGTLPENTSLRTPAVMCDRLPNSSHEDLLNNSIDAALKNALSCLPSFTNFSQSTQVPRDKCQECDEEETLYILPCQHYLCRSCLTKKLKLKRCVCSVCDLLFESKDPKRYHL